MTSKPQSIFSYGNLVHAIAGGCGSAFAMSVFFPLETVRTRVQLRKKLSAANSDQQQTPCQEDESVLGLLQRILHEEGLSGLYRGLVPVIQSLYCSNFVYFYSFHGLKKALNPNQSAVNDLLCGMAAGVINVLTTTPLWVVNTRLRLQGTDLQLEEHKRCKGMIDGLLKVYQQEGALGLWSGCTSSLMLVSNPAFQFMAYEAIKRRITGGKSGAVPPALQVFLAGAVAKAFATIITYPIQLVQARQRHSEGRRSTLQLLQMILVESGPAGLYRGLRAKLLQTVLTAALMFLCYEKIVSVVYAVMLGRSRLAAVKK
ncbi:peroxisomal membrane protein PMP34 [Hyalella azteca]|uniref:Peroxisomal membrane protein PMP34 n=1 Tax=Hyalella azteca TaxID=294128 RepID=A0A8B7NY46_HYAAZ|nr:peroxisomal membrane protein PMP34 [Hyalella azteca]